MHEGSALGENDGIIPFASENGILVETSSIDGHKEFDLQLTRDFCEKALNDIKKLLIQVNVAYQRWLQERTPERTQNLRPLYDATPWLSISMTRSSPHACGRGGGRASNSAGWSFMRACQWSVDPLPYMRNSQRKVRNSALPGPPDLTKSRTFTLRFKLAV